MSTPKFAQAHPYARPPAYLPIILAAEDVTSVELQVLKDLGATADSQAGQFFTALAERLDSEVGAIVVTFLPSDSRRR